MKKIFIPLLTVCFAGTALLADSGAAPGHKLADTAMRSDSGDNQEHKLADTAYAAGDYANAVSGYRSAMRLADEQKDVEQWARSALKLADSMLRHGDINGARGIYQEFRQRNPLRSAGTLPGDLLSAEGKYVDAEKFLIALEQSNPEFADAALFSRGMVKMRSGDIAEAYKIFAGLAKRTSPWAQQARYEMIYALIHLGKSGEALAELGNIPAAERSGYWELYHFLIDAHSGKCAELKKNFDKFIEKQPSYPAARLMELLAAAANAAVKNSDPEFAVVLLRKALEFDPEDSVKRGLYRKLINVYALNDPQQALREAQKYAADFPNAHDRGSVLNSVGKLLAEKRMTAEAMKVFATVANSGDQLISDRLEAAAQIVALAAATGSRTALEPFFRLLGDASQTPSQRSVWRRNFAEFLEQHGDKQAAYQEYLRALQAAPEAEREAAHFALLNFFIRSKDDTGIRKEADFLSGSRKPEYRAAAMFELGGLAQKSGKYIDARKFYRAAAEIPGTQVTVPAAFQAALLSLKLQEYKVAGRELSNFAAANADSPLAANALFHAVEAFRNTGDTENMKSCARKLHAKYPRSDARAFLALDEAQERSEKGDGASAIADLEQLEGIFDGRSAAGEITLLKAVLLEKNGKFEEALKEYKALLAVPGIAPDIAAECAVNSGEILFNRGNYQEAQQYFLQGAQRSPGTLFADVAIGKAVDCDLAQGRQLPAARQLENIARCERLAAATRYPQLRLQALFKLAKSYEQAGNYQEAVKACERLLYAAENIAGTGVRPDEIWCIRGTETALDIIIRHRFPGGLQRGMRMINHLEALKFPGVSGAGMRSNFREQYKKTRRK